MLTFCTLLEINEFGIADKPPMEGVELELGQLYDSYLQVCINIKSTKRHFLDIQLFPPEWQSYDSFRSTCRWYWRSIEANSEVRIRRNFIEGE